MVQTCGQVCHKTKNKSPSCGNIEFIDAMKISIDRDDFVTNGNNKTLLIHLLDDRLGGSQSTRLIAQTAYQIVNKCDAVIVGRTLIYLSFVCPKIPLKTTKSTSNLKQSQYRKSNEVVRTLTRYQKYWPNSLYAFAICT